MGVYKHLRGGTCIAIKGQSLLYQSTASSIRTRRALVPVSVIIVLVRVLNQTKVAGGGKGIVKHQHPLGLNNILNGLHAVSVEEVQLALLVVVSRLLDLLRTVRIPDVIGLFFISGIATLVLARQHVDLSLAFGAEEIEELLYSTVAMSVGVGGRRRKKSAERIRTLSLSQSIVKTWLRSRLFSPRPSRSPFNCPVTWPGFAKSAAPPTSGRLPPPPPT